MGIAFAASTSWAAAESLADLRITLSNETPRPIACRVEIAHWFALDLVDIPAGETATMRLLVDARDGTHFALNAKEEPLPVERVWCGFDGRSYETRWELPLTRTAGTQPASRRLACSDRDGMVTCE